MNLIFLTQSSRIKLFYNVMLEMKDFINLNNIGFYAVESRWFKKFKSSIPEIESEKYFLLKEWDIIRDASFIKPDIDILNNYEKKLGSPNLWAALVADRNIYSGKKYAYTQDYRKKKNHEEMLSILQVALQTIEIFYEKVKPDLFISFQCTTIGEYLFYLFAKSNNIPFLNLRPTRIKNYIFAGEDLLEPSARLKNSYEDFMKNGIDQSLADKVNVYLKTLRSTNAMYEGVIPPSNKSPGSFIDNNNQLLVIRILKSAFNAIKNDLVWKFGEDKYDNSIYSLTGYLFHQKLIRPIKSLYMRKYFRATYLNSSDLKAINYSFFPLHTEPEVTLNIYSKTYLNQIEAVRTISHSLPVGMKLVVKEHPVSVGKRSINYYKKLLEIPNVLLAPPEMPSRIIIDNAALITVISGSIALEGIIMKVPVVTLGRAPFNFLPKNMLRHVTNIDKLGFEIIDLLDNYSFDKKALISYIASNIENSVEIDFYSILSERQEAYRSGPQLDEKQKQFEYDKQIKILAKYLINQFYKYKPI